MVHIETTVSGGETPLTVAFSVTRDDGRERVATGEVTFVLVDRDFEPAPLPEAIHECIRDRGDA